MKATSIRSNWKWSTLIACFVAASALAAEPTALQLIPEADKSMGEESKGKILQIRSEKSLNSMTPNIWYIVYYDRAATFKTAEVKFGAGKKLEVKRPLRQPFAYINHDRVMDLSKLKVDSDKAVKIASEDPLLKGLTLKATRLSLEPSDWGPIWKVRLWAQRLRDPNKDADIGEVFVSAEDGKVVKSDLRPGKID